MVHERTNYTGRVYGAWTVLGPSHTTYARVAYWVCRCVCGAEKAVAISSLVSGRSTRCKSCAARQQRKRESS